MFTANSGKRNSECLLQLFEFIINLVEQILFSGREYLLKNVQKQGYRDFQLGTHFTQVFGIGKSTVIKLVNKVISELFRMSPKLIKFPKATLETGAKIRSFCDFAGCKTHNSLEQLMGRTLKLWHLLLIPEQIISVTSKNSLLTHRR